MFEAREYLRKKLIGKKVNVVVDYIQDARESLPEKTCATVTINGKLVCVKYFRFFFIKLTYLYQII